jgi:hypothetical protein
MTAWIELWTLSHHTVASSASKPTGFQNRFALSAAAFSHSYLSFGTEKTDDDITPTSCCCLGF